MELKPGIDIKSHKILIVLIVPLWNWNHNKGKKWSEWMGLNRTFMELKLNIVESEKTAIMS